MGRRHIVLLLSVHPYICPVRNGFGLLSSEKNYYTGFIYTIGVGRGGGGGGGQGII